MALDKLNVWELWQILAMCSTEIDRLEHESCEDCSNLIGWLKDLLGQVGKSLDATMEVEYDR